MWFSISNILPSWFSSWLRYWGLMDKKGKLVFLGLDNAGKTTLLGLLSQEEVKHHPPTMLPTSEQVRVGMVRFTAFDLGGHKQARRIWSNYCIDTDGLVFMVDTSDRDRVEEAGRELRAVLEDSYIKEIPVAVLGNKMDRKDAMGETELIARLGMSKFLQNNNNNNNNIRVKVFMVSVIKRQGVTEAVQWLANWMG